MIMIKDELLAEVAEKENANISSLKKGIDAGHIVIPKNKKRAVQKNLAIGKGMSTKVNANIGLSAGYSDINSELKKMEIAVHAGADTLMDLSVGPHLGKMLKEILDKCPVPVGTVPVYELASKERKMLASMREDDFISILRKQASEGVDFFTIHSGITLEATKIASRNPRILNIVSRGGALLTSWMVHNNKENPFLSRFDDILDIAKEYDIVLSLGDSLRPGSICDATDRLQIGELLILGDQQRRALAEGVQVMIEGPGHVPLDQIEANVKLQKSICNGSPFYVLGPLVTDAAPGYDHIVGAIGGAIAAWHGADFLCYVTGAEHLCLPEAEDVKRGVIASKIAAHAADIVKNVPGAMDRDKLISKARAKRDWQTQFELSLDPEYAKKMRYKSKPKIEDVCTMCSEYCSIKVAEECLGKRNSGIG